MQRRGVALDARPVALPREGNAAGNAQRTEDAPTGEQPYLARSEAESGGFLNLVVMKNELVQHTTILPRGAGVFACQPGLAGAAYAPGQLGNGLRRDSRQASIRAGTWARRSKNRLSSPSIASSSPSIQSGGMLFHAWSMTSSGKCTTWSSQGSKSSSERTPS